MASVTERTTEIKQPYGGYIVPSNFQKETFNDGITLNPIENIPASLIGTTVDYLARLLVSGQTIGEVFSEATLKGVLIAENLYKVSCGRLGVEGAFEASKRMLSNVNKLSDKASIVNICKVASFDLYYRNTFAAINAKTHYETVNPDDATIQNLQTMALRSVSFFSKYGPVTSVGFSFETDGYTETVHSGDGDYLTRDTLWDMKVQKGSITSKQTLQVLMYYIMGKHSGQEIYHDITRLGIYNPRLNIAYTLDVAKIDPAVIKAVEDDVICY